MYYLHVHVGFWEWGIFMYMCTCRFLAVGDIHVHVYMSRLAQAVWPVRFWPYHFFGGNSAGVKV